MSGITQNWWCWYSRFVISVSCLLGSVLIASLQERVFAQITPDITLPNNSSVTRDGNIFNITGGTQAESNLFHSFSEFSVITGGTASFNNTVDIQNIPSPLLTQFNVMVAKVTCIFAASCLLMLLQLFSGK